MKYQLRLKSQLMLFYNQQHDCQNCFLSDTKNNPNNLLVCPRCNDVSAPSVFMSKLLEDSF